MHTAQILCISLMHLVTNLVRMASIWLTRDACLCIIINTEYGPTLLGKLAKVL